MIRGKIAAVAALLLALGACAPVAPPSSPAAAAQPVIAITVDDIPDHGLLPPGVTRADVARDLVAALRAADAPAFGFINAGKAEADPDAMAGLEIWAGHFPVANHSWMHRSLNEVSVEEYRQDIVRNEATLRRLSDGDEWKWYRYPYLHEGDDPAKRLAIRQALSERGYRIAAVTMDFSDWAYNDHWVRCVAKGDEAGMATVEQEWLAAVRHRANASRQMAHALYGRDIPYVLLTHIGALDAKLFPRMIDMYRDMGFRIVTLEEAQADPVYAADNDPSLPPQPWTLEGKMSARGLPLPAARTPAVDLASLCL